jgi:hypothetical protein
MLIRMSAALSIDTYSHATLVYFTPRLPDVFNDKPIRVLQRKYQCFFICWQRFKRATIKFQKFIRIFLASN